MLVRLAEICFPILVRHLYFLKDSFSQPTTCLLHCYYFFNVFNLSNQQKTKEGKRVEGYNISPDRDWQFIIAAYNQSFKTNMSLVKIYIRTK